jgi:methylated-DNA-[protein]-cysteine S-methyltransferase
MGKEVDGRIILPSPVGRLLLEERGGALVRLSFENQIPEHLEQCPTPVLERTAQQLAEYFRGERQEFSVALAVEGTAFQKKVWEALCEIPYGQTRSYGQVAQMAGSPKACRAVGTANHNNPIAILIP